MKHFRLPVSLLLLGTFFLLLGGDAVAGVFCVSHYRMRSANHCHQMMQAGKQSGGGMNAGTKHSSCCCKNTNEGARTASTVAQSSSCPFRELVSKPAGRTLQSPPPASYNLTSFPAAFVT